MDEFIGMPSHSFANQTVNKCLKVTEKDNVTILLYPQSMKLAEEIAIECFKKGADALLDLYTDEYHKAYFQYLSADSLRQPSVLCRTLSENSTVEVFLSGSYDPRIYRNIPAEKLEADNWGENAAHNPITREKKVRQIAINTSLVTRPRAKAYGFNFTTWSAMMNAAAKVDYSKLSLSGKKLRERLSSEMKLRVTHPNGTDLEVGLENAKWNLSDGVIDEEDIRSENYLDAIPAGSISANLNPNFSRTSGKITFNTKVPFAGKNAGKISLEFREGRVVSFTRDETSRRVRDIYDKASGDRDAIALFEIGVNPRAKVGYTVNNISSGVITVGIGSNGFVGGPNRSSFFHAQSLAGATVESDGTTIVKSGKHLDT
jgi:leucyl aminopeptidase (aminopeptidase T)